MRGRNVPLSPARRLVAGYCALAQDVPRGVLSGELALGVVVAARAAAWPRPPWPALFAKAHALAAAEMPELRQVFVKLPWPHLYELPASVAAIVVEREAAGEKALFLARVKRPEGMALPAIAEAIRHAKEAPEGEVPDWQVAMRVARLPWALRRGLLWLGRNWGRQVPNHFGSFGISVIGNQGIAFAHAVSLWTSFLTYGPIDADGRAEIYLCFDHRVFDGAAAARAFRLVESKLLGPVLEELLALAAPAEAGLAAAGGRR